MTHRGFRTRKTYAPGHRKQGRNWASPSRFGGYHTYVGEGVLKQTCSGQQYGFSAPIVEHGNRADGMPLFFIESEQYADRYYAVFQQPDGSWFFSGDAKLAKEYILRVWDWLISQSTPVVLEQAPAPSAPVYPLCLKLQECAARKQARMKREAFAYACARVRAIEYRWQQQAVIV